jgi:hypothetical protein
VDWVVIGAKYNIQYFYSRMDRQTQKEKLKHAVQNRSYEACSPVACIYGSKSTAVGLLLLFCFVVQNFLPEYNFYVG